MARNKNAHLTREQLLEKAQKLHKQCGTGPIARMLAKNGVPLEDALRVLARRSSTDLDFTK